MKRWNSWYRNILAIAGAALIFLIPVFTATAIAEDTAATPHMNPARILKAIQKKVTIQEKTPVDILANKVRYAVTPATVIVMGKDAMAFSDMPVPCKAKVYYETRNNQDPEAVKIEVLDFSATASRAWGGNGPQ